MTKYAAAFIVVTTFLLQACSSGSDNAGVQEFGTVDPDPAEIINVDIQSSLFSGDLLIDSSVYQQSDFSSYAMEISNATDSNNRVFLGYLFDERFEVSVIQGLYLPEYYYQFGETVPLNYAERLPQKINTAANLEQDIDVQSVIVAAQFLLDGEAFPTVAGEVASIYLQSSASDEMIFIGTTNASNPPVRILPGEYSVIYQYQSGDFIPVNTHAVLPDTLNLSSSGPVQIRMESATVRSIFTLNGTAFPNDAYDYGRITLVNQAQGDSATLGNSYESVTSTRVLFGDYTAHYLSREPGGLTPRNTDSIIDDDIVIDQPSEELLLNVDVIEVAGQFTVNGTPAPVSAYEYARISLLDPKTGAATELGNTFSQSYLQMRIIPGDYDLLYEHREGDTLPQNRETVFAKNVSITTDGNFDIDIPVVNFSASFTLNGEAFPLSAYDYAAIYINESGVDTGDEYGLDFGDSFDGIHEINLLPGQYDLVYRVRESAFIVPVNQRMRFISSLDVLASTHISHDFISRKVQLAPTLNGAAFPASAYSSAELHLGSNARERISFGRTDMPSEPRYVLTGDYTIYYSVSESGDGKTVPMNSNAVVGSVTID